VEDATNFSGKIILILQLFEYSRRKSS